jgi:hypothetical protein
MSRTASLSKRSAFSFALFDLNASINASKVALGEDACFPPGFERRVGPQGLEHCCVFHF